MRGLALAGICQKGTIMGNNRPYFRWTFDKMNCVDIGKAEYLYPHRRHSGEDVAEQEDENRTGNAWEVRAKINPGETRTDEDYLLAYTKTLEGAREYITTLMIQLNSNMRDTDGSPLIIETVSPESFQTVATALAATMAAVALAMERGDIENSNPATLLLLTELGTEVTKLIKD